MTWERKEEDYDLTIEELHEKYENDPMYWKERYEHEKKSKDRLETKYWNFPKFKTLYKSGHRRSDEKIEDIDVESTCWAILDVSFDRDKLRLCGKLAEEQNKYYREVSNKDEDWTCAHGVLQDALEIGINVVLGEGHMTEEELNYNDCYYDLPGWQKTIDEFLDLPTYWDE